MASSAVSPSSWLNHVIHLWHWLTYGQNAAALQTRVARELEILRLESHLGIDDQEQAVILNISHSTVANLNLGTVIGDLTASVQILAG